MCRTLCLTAAALLVASSLLTAQDSATAVVPGRLIRVQVIGGGVTQGTVTAVDGGRILLAVAGADTVALSRAEVGRIEMYQGTKSRVGKNALTGGLIGAGLGAVLGAVSASATEGSLVEFSAGQGAVAGGLTFGVLGAGIGALTGISKRPIWKTVSPSSVFVTPASDRGNGVAVGMNLRF